MQFDEGIIKNGNKKGLNYEKAMKQAFGEIFRNLREIENDTRKKRHKIDLERRRASAPCTTLRETTRAAVNQLKKEELGRTFSVPLSPKSSLTKDTKPSLSTRHWVLACFDEEEDMQFTELLHGDVSQAMLPIANRGETKKQ